MYHAKDYINRLRTVSFKEFAYRIKRLARTWYYEKKAFAGKGLVQVPEIDLSFLDAIILPRVIHSETGKETASHESDFLSFERKKRPLFFSKIKIEDMDPDIRSVWEPARLQEGFRDGEGGIRTRVMTWIDDNPFLHGVHYLSPMECALRIPVFFFTLKRLDRELEKKKTAPLLSAVFCHAWWVSRNMALYSSLGNHTICESVGLIFAGVLFNETREGDKWFSKGVILLEEGLSHQILPDGGPGEQSLAYLRFVLDLYWFTLDFLEANHRYDCEGWKERLRRGEAFLNAFTYDKDRFPSIGDDDGGYALGPGLVPHREANCPEWPDSLQGLDSVTFPHAGYSVIRTGNEVFLAFDHGPLGMGPLYNHGHADALSVVYYKKGRPFFVDPGTYRYNGAGEYRSYFKGTRAHNTVCIDGKDQAEQVSGFIWDKPFKSRLTQSRQWSGRILLRGCHDGYTRLREPVTHERELVFHDKTCWVIKDSFSGQGRHEFEVNFHLHPGVRIEKKENWFFLNNGGERLFMYDPEGLFSIARGRINPLLGWYSKGYGLLEKTNTIQAVKSGDPDCVIFITLIGLDESQLNAAAEIYREYQ